MAGSTSSNLSNNNSTNDTTVIDTSTSTEPTLSVAGNTSSNLPNDYSSNMTTLGDIKTSTEPILSTNLPRQEAPEDLKPIIDVFLNPELKEERQQVIDDTLAKLKEIFK